ncbi:MAG: XRE family transcriptional regulator [Elusimicrobiota bacterium]|nr:XRE family transcriptional regulator [Elusimicrobiota bacterium]
MDLGSRLRDFRRRRKMTLEELAKRTGLTSSFLSQVERNITSPSVKSLREIANALNTKVGCFFEEENGRDFIFIKKDNRRRVVNDGLKSFYEVLASDLLGIRMEPSLLVLKSGGMMEKQPGSLDGEEFAFVLKGRVELLRGTEKFIMEKGDSIYFKGVKSYKLVNIGSNEANLLWVVSS